jgi:hypothetical protein
MVHGDQIVTELRRTPIEKCPAKNGVATVALNLLQDVLNTVQAFERRDVGSGSQWGHYLF